MRPKSSIAQVLSVVLTIVSITLSIFFYLEKQKNASLSQTVEEQAMKIMGAEAKIREHEQRIEAMHYDNEIDRMAMERATKLAQTHYQDAMRKQVIIDNLKKRLYEMEMVNLAGDDNDQYRIFIQWTGQ
jgi:uncharacterized membrane protein